MDKLFTSIQHTCEITDCGRTSVYKLIRQGHLRTIKLNGRRLVEIESVLNLRRLSLQEDPRNEEQ